MAPDLLPVFLVVLAASAASIAVYTDLKARRIPDWLTLPTLATALLGRLAMAGISGPLGLLDGLLGLAVAFLAFFLLALGGGMGMGDVKLMAAIGAILGWERTLYALVFVSLAGGVQAIAWTLRSGRLLQTLVRSLRRLVRPFARPEKDEGQYLPYAVAIAAGTLATFLFRGFALLLALFVAAGPRSAAAESVIHLGVGTQKVLKIRGGIQRIAVGNPEIADVRPLGDGEILVVGVREGRTTLLVWRASGARDSHLVVVRKVSTEDLADEVRALLGEREGLVVRAAGERVIIDGEAYTPEDHRRVQAVLELYPDVRSMVRVTEHARNLSVAEINRELRRAGLGHVVAQAIGGRIVLEGHVESEVEKRKAELVVAALGETAENLVQLGLRRMVLSEVHFLEVRRSKMRQLGIRFPFDVAGSAAAATAIQGNFPVDGGGRVTVGSYEALVEGTGQWSLRMAVDKGFGRLLAQPTLVCASGEEAEFLAGGEVPLPLITQNSNTVEYRKYGVVLRLRPTADRNGNIVTEIEAEVSELDRSVAVAVGPNVSVPGFRNRSVKTSVTVRSGETIVLSGVYTLDEQKSVSKVPLLGDIPILGELFKQRTTDDTERELLIFVTPRLVNPESREVVSAIERMRETYEAGERELGFGILD
ncbi:MAG: pilus assembly protein N-terminal domain-containing protein [Pseudomonadota bacterium]